MIEQPETSTPSELIWKFTFSYLLGLSKKWEIKSMKCPKCGQEIPKRTLGDDIVPNGVHVRDCEGMLTVEKVKKFLADFLEEMDKAQSGLPCTGAEYHTIIELKQELRNRAGFQLIGYY